MWLGELFLIARFLLRKPMERLVCSCRHFHCTWLDHHRNVGISFINLQFHNSVLLTSCFQANLPDACWMEQGSSGWGPSGAGACGKAAVSSGRVQQGMPWATSVPERNNVKSVLPGSYSTVKCESSSWCLLMLSFFLVPCSFLPPSYVCFHPPVLSFSCFSSILTTVH